jgi:tetratricopeptide (TPR) repeat protein
MSQRLLEANQRQLTAAPDAVGRLRLLQDRAILLARLGRVDEAREVLSSAERDTAADTPPTLVLRLDYARAIVTYFSRRFADALREMEAVLARVQGQERPAGALLAECESALALFVQREGNVRAAAQYARSVLARAEATLEARYRASLALASLHQDARDHETAYRLFRETHDVVRALDDEIAMASALQRAAVSRAAHVRQEAAIGELDTRSLNEAVEALLAAIAYIERLPDGPGAGLDHLLLAEMRVLQKRYQEALAIYDRHIEPTDQGGFLHEVTAAMADRARCLLELGQLDDGYGQAVAALRRVDDATPADIRAIVHDNMANALLHLGHRGESEQHRILSRMAWETYAHEQREARRLLHESSHPTLH